MVASFCLIKRAQILSCVKPLLQKKVVAILTYGCFFVSFWQCVSAVHPHRCGTSCGGGAAAANPLMFIGEAVLHLRAQSFNELRSTSSVQRAPFNELRAESEKSSMGKIRKNNNFRSGPKNALVKNRFCHRF